VSNRDAEFPRPDMHCFGQYEWHPATVPHVYFLRMCLGDLKVSREIAYYHLQFLHALLYHNKPPGSDPKTIHKTSHAWLQGLHWSRSGLHVFL